jgi:hypothetical protein
MELTAAHWQYANICYTEFYPNQSRKVEGTVIKSFMPISDMPATTCWKTFYKTSKPDFVKIQ